MKIEFKPIGVIHSPFSELTGMPIQPAGAAGVKGTVEIYEEYHAGLQDLDGFSHIILLYFFHRSRDYKLTVVPYLDSELVGASAIIDLAVGCGQHEAIVSCQSQCLRRHPRQ